MTPIAATIAMATSIGVASVLCHLVNVVLTFRHAQIAKFARMHGLVEVIHDKKLAHCIASPMTCRIGCEVITAIVNYALSLNLPMDVVLLALVPSNVHLASTTSPCFAV